MISITDVIDLMGTSLGCAACHRNFLFCPSTDPPNYDWPSFVPDDSINIDVTLPPYPDPNSPDETNEILASRAVREVGWNDGLAEIARYRGWRANQCSRHNVDSLTEITEFTRVGKPFTPFICIFLGFSMIN